MMNKSANLAAEKKHSLNNSLKIPSINNSKNKGFSKGNNTKLTNN